MPAHQCFRDSHSYDEQARPRLANNVAPVDVHAQLTSLGSLPAFPHALYDSECLRQGHIRVIVETKAAPEHMAQGRRGGHTPCKDDREDTCAVEVAGRDGQEGVEDSYDGLSNFGDV